MGNEINKRVVLIIAAIGSFLTPFMGSSIVVALPFIGKEFGMNTVSLNWSATAFLLASAIFVVPFGRLSDIYGRRKTYLWGIIIFAAASILCGISVSTHMFIAARAIQGFGGAMIFGTGVAILTSVYPPKERGKVLGINVAVVYLGSSVGPFFGGIMTQQLGWRSIFFVTAAIGIAAALLVIVLLKHEWKEAKGESFDYAGSVIYGIGLLAFMCGLSFMKTEWWGILVFVLGTIALIFFAVLEMRFKNPVLDIRLFATNRVLLFSTLAALINYSATYAVSYLLSLYLQYVKGFDPQYAGLILMAQPVAQALLSPAAGKLSDCIEPQRVASIGMLLSVIGLVGLIFINNATGMAVIVVCLIVLGIGFALFSSPNTNAIMSSVDKRYYGVTSGLIGTARLVGQTISMAVAAMVFALYMGNAQITITYHPHFMESMRVIFMILAALCLLGIFASLARGKMHQENKCE